MILFVFIHIPASNVFIFKIFFCRIPAESIDKAAHPEKFEVFLCS